MRSLLPVATLASALAIVLMAVVTLAYLFCARWLKIERA